MISVTAPAKIILFGEHAVVYGQPAIAVPVFGLQAEATIKQSDKPLTIVARDLNNRVIRFNDGNPLAQTARLTIEKLGVTVPHATLNITSKIPIASGLGSGAAISTVIVKAIAQYCHEQLTNETINQIVYEIEKLHHGTPSGIDNTVVVYEQAIYFVRDEPIQHIINAKALRFVVANTGIPAPTKVAVGDVGRLMKMQELTTKPMVEGIGALVKQARTAMQEGDIARLGELMTENHQYLRKLTVSSDMLDRFVDTANDAGALGAKLSGGGRGGNMIALVTDKTDPAVKEALLNVGAVDVFSTVVEATIL